VTKTASLPRTFQARDPAGGVKGGKLGLKTAPENTTLDRNSNSGKEQ
jgi:hypothetical protein